MKSKLGHRYVVQGNDPGFYGEKPHILTYNPGQVFKLLLPFLAPHLTVCNTFSMWRKHLVWMMYAIALGAVLSNTCFPDTEMGEKGNVIPACMNKNNIQICQLEMTMMFWKGEFRFLIAFMLAGFVAATIKTWTIRRTMYASLCGNMRNLTIKLSSFIPIDVNDAEITQARQNLGRWVALAFDLAVLKSRGQMDSEQGREHLQTSGLLKDGEWDAMVKGDRHSTVFWWIHIQCSRLQRKGILHSNDVTVISESIGDMRAKANDLMSSLDLDKPISYTSLCGLLVTINLFIMSTWKAVEWSTWMRTFGWGLTEQPKFYFDVLGLLVWNVSYKALYDLAYLLHNPFGPREIDVAHETIFKGLRTLATELMDGESHLPPTIGVDKYVRYI